MLNGDEFLFISSLLKDKAEKLRGLSYQHEYGRLVTLQEGKNVTQISFVDIDYEKDIVKT